MSNRNKLIVACDYFKRLFTEQYTKKIKKGNIDLNLTRSALQAQMSYLDLAIYWKNLSCTNGCYLFYCSSLSCVFVVFVIHIHLCCTGNLLLTQNVYLEATEEVSLDSPERDPILSPEPTPAITPVTPTTLVAPRMESKSVTAPVIFDRSREEVCCKLLNCGNVLLGFLSFILF